MCDHEVGGAAYCYRDIMVETLIEWDPCIWNEDLHDESKDVRTRSISVGTLDNE